MKSGVWLKLDACYYLDDSILAGGEAAEVLYLRGLALAKQTLSDGYLTRRQLLFLGLEALDARIEALVHVGLWLEVEGGWQIRSWLAWNRTAAEVADIRVKRQEAGRLGGRPSKQKQIAKQSAKQVGNIMRKQFAKQTVNPEVEVEVEVETEVEERISTAVPPAVPSSTSSVGAEPKRLDAVGLPFLEFPTVGTNGKVWMLTQGQVDQWAALFPALDVAQQCRQALAWIEANSAKRKTCRGMPRFLTAWLTRATDRPPVSRADLSGVLRQETAEQLRLADEENARAHRPRRV